MLARVKISRAELNMLISALRYVIVHFCDIDLKQVTKLKNKLDKAMQVVVEVSHEKNVEKRNV